MSEESGKKDPSMEEILGSIRKIISEDNAPGAAAGQQAPAEAEDDDFLELTEEVSEDADERREPVLASMPSGSPEPVENDDADRKEPVFAEPPPASGDEPMILEEPAAEIDPADLEDPAAGIEPADLEGPAAGNEPAAAEAAPDAAAPAESGEGSTVDIPELSDSEMDDAWAREVAANKARASQAQSSEGDAMPTTPQDEQPADVAPAPAETSKPGLVSKDASSAAAASLGELSKAAAGKTGKLQFGEGATLEDMVREMIKPMLGQWLDENLPGIVERLVRREIKNMADQALDED